MNTSQLNPFRETEFLEKYRKKKPSGTAFLQYIDNLHRQGGPDPGDYNTINEVLNHYISKLTPEQTIRLHKRLAKVFGPDYVESTAGHATIKPYGYPGDYEIMDRMYLYKHSERPEFAKWDRFYHWQAAAKCIINRKTYFKTEVKKKLADARARGEDLHVMNIACGPGRDVFELFNEESQEGLYFDFVDADLNAILHATRLNAKYLSHIRFHNCSIFRLKAEKKVDFLWSGGLFDYFDDETFVSMMAKVHHYVRPGGEMIIGNVSPFNPTRGYMELFVGWFIHHRSEQELIDMAKAACGDRLERVWVGEEPEGVNLFVHVQLK